MLPPADWILEPLSEPAYKTLLAIASGRSDLAVPEVVYLIGRRLARFNTTTELVSLTELGLWAVAFFGDCEDTWLDETTTQGNA